MFSAGGISLAIKVDIIAFFFEVGINCLNLIAGAIVQCGFNPRLIAESDEGFNPRLIAEVLSRKLMTRI